MDVELLGRMCGAIRHRGPDGEARRIAGAVGFGCLHLWVTREEVGERQPLVGPSGTMLVVDGRVDNREELLGPLGLPGTASDARCLLTAYERWGERFVERVKGDFALGLFDPRNERLVLARDALGVRPLYYHHRPGLFLFASEIKALLQHPDVPARPDDAGLADVLTLSPPTLEGQYVTCFAGVSAVEAAHLVVVTPAGLVGRRYWDFDPGRQIAFRSFGEYVEAFRERFVQAVRRRARSAHPVAVLVSGGLDSSSVFCQAETLRRALPGLFPELVGISHTSDTHGAADERAYLAEIETTYGVAVDRVPLERHVGVVDGAEEEIWHVEIPLLDYLWSATRAMHWRARARGARVLLSGHWGDQMLFSSAYLADLFRTLRWVELWRHVREYRRWLADGEVKAHVRRCLLDLTRRFVPPLLHQPLKRIRHRISVRPPRPWYADAFVRRVRQAVQRSARLEPRFHSAQARQLYLEARSKYHVRCLEWDNKVAAMHGLDFAFPYLDRDLVAFLLATPGRFHNYCGVPRALLRGAMRGVLPEALRARSWKADFTELVNLGVEQDFPVIAGALSGQAAGVRRGYLDAVRLPREVHALSRRLQGPDCLNSWDLTDAFGLEMWLRVFFRGESAGHPERDDADSVVSAMAAPRSG